jgi:hypothetical protein
MRNQVTARSLLGLTGLVALLGLLITGSSGAGQATVRFGPPVYVDQQLAGGEPEAIADTLHGKLVYTAHEGTTISIATGTRCRRGATSRSSPTTATR